MPGLLTDLTWARVCGWRELLRGTVEPFGGVEAAVVALRHRAFAHEQMDTQLIRHELLGGYLRDWLDTELPLNPYDLPRYDMRRQ